jgi:O-6-methylguanine DNA methyltransferase
MNLFFYTIIDLPYSKAICVSKNDSILLFKALVYQKNEEIYLNKFSAYSLKRYKNEALQLLEKEIDLYFDNKIKIFSSKLSPGGSTFQKIIWNSLLKIPYAETLSYKEFSRNYYSGNHTRACASAIAKNPIEILLPCHRVIKTDGSYGNYSAGYQAKKFLNELETNNRLITRI